MERAELKLHTDYDKKCADWLSKMSIDGSRDLASVHRNVAVACLELVNGAENDALEDNIVYLSSMVQTSNYDQSRFSCAAAENKQTNNLTNKKNSN